MGCCLSKKDPVASNSIPPPCNKHPNPNPYPKVSPVSQVKQKVKIEVEQKNEDEKKINESKKMIEEEKGKKKEVFVIQHRKSNDRRGEGSDGSGSNSNNDPGQETGQRSDPNGGVGSNILEAAASGQAVRTSSCTKEEVDAILIQCGRLSRSSSGKGNGNGRRYCGSKRSFDFERENEIGGDVGMGMEMGFENGGGEEDERLRRRQSRGSHRRRTTPSRSRERGEQQQQQQQQQQRSGSRERGERSGGSRRVSRSPGRRSESPLPNTGNENGNGNGRPGKLVSVPATVSSLSGNGNDGGNVKRVLVKRNVGSPRSRSPARGNQVNGNGGNQQQQQQQPQPPSLSRNGSRKESPYRRTPLNEIDMNSLPFQPLANTKRPVNKGKEVEDDVAVVVKQPLNNSASQSKYSETNNKVAGQGFHRRSNSRGAEGYEVTRTNYCRVNEQLQTPAIEQMTDPKLDDYDAMVTPVVVSGTESHKLPQTLMRSRSGRRSRDLDINVDALLNPNPATNYNALLLQDIQNFHQKKNSSSNTGNPSTNSDNSSTTPYSHPPCVTKACSILEAVADLNSSTGLVSPRATAVYHHHGKKRLDVKDPFVESEVKVGDDLMEPSFHKYVTVRKRGGDLHEEESSGSNSFIGSGSHQQQNNNWVSSSSNWEPNSADSTDCWTSKSYTLEDDRSSPLGCQRLAVSDIVACGIMDQGSSDSKFVENGIEKLDHYHQIRGGVRLAGARAPVQSSRAAVAGSM